MLQAAPEDAVAERERAQTDRRLEVRRRDDGLVDLFAWGITGPNAHACLSRIQAAAAPVGPDDRRTADQRRLDALVDLLTGRIALPLPGMSLDACDGDPAATTPGACAAGGCGCPSGASVPCGADTQVLVPLGAALGTTGEVAELVGSGPLDPDLLGRLLLASPRLRAVWVDENGVPVATSSRTWQPDRGDPADLRTQLLALAAQVPPAPEPRHPLDHPPGAPPGDPTPGSPAPAVGGPPSPTCSSWSSSTFWSSSTWTVARPDGREAPWTTPPGRPATTGAPPRPSPSPSPSSLPLLPVRGGHPPGTPGPYRVGERLRRLLTVRRPWCEWPGCGMPARRCDMEHDVAWPKGPTCACQVGPCCRHHHRIKQTGWTKTRTAMGVCWTGPTGRSWSSPTPHRPPARPVRPLPPLPVEDPLALLSRLEWEHELDAGDPLLDGAGFSDRCDDTEPVETADPVRQRLRWTDTTWTLDLADVQAWQDVPHTADR